jgi:hypothetical protein
MDNNQEVMRLNCNTNEDLQLKGHGMGLNCIATVRILTTERSWDLRFPSDTCMAGKGYAGR